mgnify:CR=1 FL=1
MSSTAPMAPTTDFVPADLDATTWAAIEPIFVSLRDREVESAAAFEQWLVDRSELEAACSESAAAVASRGSVEVVEGGAVSGCATGVRSAHEHSAAARKAANVQILDWFTSRSLLRVEYVPTYAL